MLDILKDLIDFLRVARDLRNPRLALRSGASVSKSGEKVWLITKKKAFHEKAMFYNDKPSLFDEHHPYSGAFHRIS